MKVLLYLPLISIGIGFIVGLIASCHKSSKGTTPEWDVHLPDGEEYKDKLGTPTRDNPSLSEQLDGRLTNIFPNPWEGIL